MMVSAFGRVDDLGRSPTIHGWIVSPAPVQIRTAKSSPDDHFTASPHRGLVVLVAVQLSVLGLYLPPVLK
jgi:hypothetical protein